MRYGRQPSIGVKGWLLFFVVTLTLNAAGACLMAVDILANASLSHDFGPAMRGYVETVVAAGVLRGGGYGYLAWRLVARREPSTVRVAIVGLWLLVLCAFAVQLIATAAFFGTGPLSHDMVVTTATVSPLGYAAIWTAYLLRSDRVADTYAGDEQALAGSVR